MRGGNQRVCLLLEKYIFKFIYNETIVSSPLPPSSVYNNSLIDSTRGETPPNYSFVINKFKNLFSRQNTFIASFKNSEVESRISLPFLSKINILRPVFLNYCGYHILKRHTQNSRMYKFKT